MYNVLIFLAELLVKNIMLGIFLKAFSQSTTSQGYFPKWQLPNCAISQVATWEVAPAKMPFFGKCPLPKM